MNSYKVIGVMSGTSLDGLDLAYCHFIENNGKWTFQLLKSTTINYSEKWKTNLSSMMKSDALSLTEMNKNFGVFIGENINLFIQKNHIVEIDLISSHGHTIFHQPEKKLTLQIGDGASISAITGITTVCDFRSTDVGLGGQGAPLVPIGDTLLFSEYDYCLNLGGIANISYRKNSGAEYEIIAFDICPCNLVLNFLSTQMGMDFDENGKIASSGNIDQSLLQALNNLEFYSKKFPKSLGKEWIDKVFLPVLNSSPSSVPDKMRTMVEHIAIQISNVLNATENETKGTLLISGGGALNHFLALRISDSCKTKTTIPEKGIINFKEALIFAFLGVLRIRNEVNCLRSVTGASRNSCGGAVYLGKL